VIIRRRIVCRLDDCWLDDGKIISKIEAISTMDISPALIKELRCTVPARRKKKRPAVSVGKRGTHDTIASHRISNQLAGKRKDN